MFINRYSPAALGAKSEKKSSYRALGSSGLEHWIMIAAMLVRGRWKPRSDYMQGTRDHGRCPWNGDV